MILHSDPNAGSLTPELLRYLESRIGEIPSDYCRFLLSKNGGIVNPDFELQSVSLPEDVKPAVYEFCSINCSRGAETVDLDIERWALNFGTNFVPIASDGIGNDFLISVGEGNAGHVYFRNHEEVDEDVAGSGLTRVAESFTDFLSQLHQSEPTLSGGRPRELSNPQVSLQPLRKPWWRFW